ncbi:uncharacterized protein LOC111348307 isoform X2 [Spodoptera litura]|uniref:Uncharacterized protein LOC111348307 isoform X2 n=1 Tax=Spodoptera litura TaxID=69820 RepID=A0A9J7DM09_SPOLT|nr:uncharacterized protein LOC111348307 isoform X2 [Spodoptera litura]
MAQSQFSLMWDAHKKNICHGLSSLQQNGEFVDMTLAADGHLVKVHQVIIALASPYIKELISTAQCPHPVIFLNKLSDTSTQQAPETPQNDNETDCNMESLDEEISYFEITKDTEDDTKYMTNIIVESENGTRILNTTAVEQNYDEEQDDEDSMSNDKTITETQHSISTSPNLSVMQFTVSNQGSLQMILNRYMYYLKYTNRNNMRQWRCVDYLSNIKCPAHVFTKDDIVVQRISAHVHPFHDKRILKKVKAGAVFSAIHEAEQQQIYKRNDTNISD